MRRKLPRSLVDAEPVERLGGGNGVHGNRRLTPWPLRILPCSRSAGGPRGRPTKGGRWRSDLQGLRYAHVIRRRILGQERPGLCDRCRELGAKRRPGTCGKSAWRSTLSKPARIWGETGITRYRRHACIDPPTPSRQKPGTEFPDYTMPGSYPDYPHHTEILAYLRGYAEHFELGAAHRVRG